MSVSISAKWQSDIYSFVLDLSSNVGDLQDSIAQHFSLARPIKLIGLSKSKPPASDITLSSLGYHDKDTIKLSIIGQPVHLIQSLKEQDANYNAKKDAEEKKEKELKQRLDEQQLLYKQQLLHAEAEQRIRNIESEERRRIEYRLMEERRQKAIAEALDREREEEQNLDNSVSFSYSCLRSKEADRKEKLILPPSALQSIISGKVAFPLTFQVSKKDGETGKEMDFISNNNHSMEHDLNYSHSNDTNTNNSSFTSAQLVCYYGVDDFSSPDSTLALVPTSLINSLQINEGDQVIMKTVRLPKATHLTLLPIPQRNNQSSICTSTSTTSSSSSSSVSPFFLLDENERTALLEFHLRKHSFLVKGSTFHINIHRETPIQLSFLVKNLEPANVCSIIESEVSTEVERIEDEEKSKDIELFDNEESIEGILDKDALYYFSSDLPDPNSVYTFTLQSIVGDFDLYLSYSRLPPPSPTLYQYSNEEFISTKIIELSSKLPDWKNGKIFGLIKSQEKGNFSITLKKSDHSPSNNNSLSTPSLQSPYAPSNSSSTDSVICHNCDKEIPARIISIHEIGCRKTNYRCPECQKVVPLRYRSKHQYLYHQNISCPSCSYHDNLQSVRRHRQEDCIYRLVDCIYCPIRIEMISRGEHQADCGLQQSNCKLCHQSMSRKLIRRHYRVDHGIEKKTIHWKDFWN